MFSTDLITTSSHTFRPVIAAYFFRRSNPSELADDPSINSNGSSSSLLVQMRKLCIENRGRCLDRIMDMNTGIKSNCSLDRNQRRYRSPNRLSDGHSGVFHSPVVEVVPGSTTSDCNASTPSEEGCALVITNSSKFDMEANAFVQAEFVASIVICRIRGPSRPSCRAWLENSANSRSPRGL